MTTKLHNVTILKDNVITVQSFWTTFILLADRKKFSLSVFCSLFTYIYINFFSLVKDIAAELTSHRANAIRDALKSIFAKARVLQIAIFSLNAIGNQVFFIYKKHTCLHFCLLKTFHFPGCFTPTRLDLS